MLSKHHYITVRNKGTFHGDADYPTEPEDIDRLFDYLTEHDINRIAIFIHGGLVKEPVGMQAAENMYHKVFNPIGIHSIGLVWKSGFKETLVERFDEIHKTKLFRKLLVKILKKVASRLGLGIAGKGIQELSEDELMAELEKADPFSELDDAAKGPEVLVGEVDDRLLKRELEAELRQEIDRDQELQELMQNPDENFWLKEPDEEQQQEAEAKGSILWPLVKGLGSIIYRSIKRKRNGTWHGPHATAIEEMLREIAVADFAKYVWSGMKQKAMEMWQEHEGNELAQMHVGRYFLDKLLTFNEQRNLIVDLVAHSAGAVVTCEWLKVIASERLSLKLRNILFLAPACTMELFHDTIMQNQHLFDRFRMFTMFDKYEAEDKLINNLGTNLYPSSLLYFVSGVCEAKVDQPILGMERYHSEQRPYAENKLIAVAQYLKEAGTDRAAWSRTEDDAQAGMRSHSIDHGYFDNDPETLTSIRSILRH